MKQTDWRIAMDRHMCHQNGPPPPWECAWQPYLPFLVRDGGKAREEASFVALLSIVLQYCTLVLHTMPVIYVDASWSQQQQ